MAAFGGVPLSALLCLPDCPKEHSWHQRACSARSRRSTVGRPFRRGTCSGCHQFHSISNVQSFWSRRRCTVCRKLGCPWCILWLDNQAWLSSIFYAFVFCLETRIYCMCLIFFYPNLTAEARALLTLLRGLCILTRVPCFPNLLLVKFGGCFSECNFSENYVY